MKLILPLPPSANAYWRHVGNKVLLSKGAREYRERCAMAAAGQCRGRVFNGRVRIRADVYRDLRADLDNMSKQLLDALQGIVLLNDAQVWDLRLVRHLDRENPRVVLTIHQIAEAA